MESHARQRFLPRACKQEWFLRMSNSTKSLLLDAKTRIRDNLYFPCFVLCYGFIIYLYSLVYFLYLFVFCIYLYSIFLVLFSGLRMPCKVIINDLCIGMHLKNEYKQGNLLTLCLIIHSCYSFIHLLVLGARPSQGRMKWWKWLSLYGLVYACPTR